MARALTKRELESLGVAAVGAGAVIALIAGAAAVTVAYAQTPSASNSNYVVTQDSSGTVSLNGSPIGSKNLGDALNPLRGGSVLIRSSTTAYSSTGVMLQSGITLNMEPGVLINDLSTAKLPGNIYNGAAIRNANFRVDAYSQDRDITIRGGTIRPGPNNFGVAFGGVTNALRDGIRYDMSIGYGVAQDYAAQNFTDNNTVSRGPIQQPFYTYGIGQSVGAFTPAPLVSYHGRINNPDMTGITGNALNPYGSDIVITNPTVDMGEYPGSPTDAFVDIESDYTRNAAIAGIWITDGVFRKSRSINHQSLSAMIAVGQAVAPQNISDVHLGSPGHGIRLNLYSPDDPGGLASGGITIPNSPTVDHVYVDDPFFDYVSGAMRYMPNAGQVFVNGARYRPNGAGLGGAPFWFNGIAPPANSPNWQVGPITYL